MSERKLFHAKWAFLQPYHVGNKLPFNEIMKSDLYYINMISSIFIVLLH